MPVQFGNVDPPYRQVKKPIRVKKGFISYGFIAVLAANLAALSLVFSFLALFTAAFRTQPQPGAQA